MEDSFEMLRSERRSFFCTNKLWMELQRKTIGYCSVSQYIKTAVVEKMIRENPRRGEFYKELLFNR